MNDGIEELTTREELLAALPLVQILRPEMNQATFLEYLYEMLPLGYRIFGMFEQGQLVSTVLVLKQVDWYMGRHVWFFGLSTLPEFRSRGYGKQLLEFVAQWAQKNKCTWIGVPSEAQLTAAHRFYADKAGMFNSHLVFGKNLPNN